MANRSSNRCLRNEVDVQPAAMGQVEGEDVVVMRMQFGRVQARLSRPSEESE